MKNVSKFIPDHNLRLMDKVFLVLRYYYYEITTMRTYCKWILRFIRCCGARRQPRDMGAISGLRRKLPVHFDVPTFET